MAGIGMMQILGRFGTQLCGRGCFFVYAAAALMICAVMVMPCCSEEDMYDENLRVFEGKVAAVDVGNSSITVESGEIRIAFPVSLKTELLRDALDIRLFDFKKGDYVTVEYLRSGSESRVPLEVKKVTLEYSDSAR